jgi:acyl carrier protein
MGLDAVEIVMKVEEVFDLTIDDADAMRLDTPRDLIELICRNTGQIDSSSCLTQRAFNLLRKALLHRLPLKRAQIAPAVRLADLVSEDRRAGLLTELAAELNTGPLPDLERPPWLLKTFAVLSVTLGFLAGFALRQAAPPVSRSLTFAAGLAVAVFAQACAWFATAPFCKAFPSIIGTVGDLARWVTAHKTDLATRLPGRWTREQVAARVREIVIEQLGCEKNYRESASFVKDLGLS